LLNNLESFLQKSTRVVIIGMGNELRGDDGVGVEVVRRLKRFENKRLFVFEGGMTPEVFIAPACKKQPSHLLIVDAAELQMEPGSWRLLSGNELDAGLFTTHAIPATEVSAEIQRRCGSQVAFLGIQPKTRDVALQLSPECTAAVRDIVSTLQRLLSF